MYTKEQIHAQMRELGIDPSGLVTIHSSMKSVGEVEGRGEGFIDILIDYFDENGIVTFPAHTWGNIGKDIPTMDVTKPEEICIGLIARLAASHPKGHRSMHPTHSMTAFSKNDRLADAFIAGECMVDSSTNIKGCYGKLYDRGGKVLLIGVGHNRDTYIHSVEERLNIPNRMSPEMIPTTIKLESGDIINRPIHCHKAVGIGDVSAHYPKLEPLFEKAGAIRRGKIGDADCQLCDCKIMFDVYASLHASHPEELFSDDEPIPTEWY